MSKDAIKFVILSITVLYASHAAAQQSPTASKSLYQLPSPYERFSHFQLTPRVGGARPVGGLADQYIASAAFPTLTLAMEWVQPKRISVGLELGTYSFDKRLSRALYEFDNQQISAVQTRTLRSSFAQGTASYHFASPTASFRPYVQAGIGVELIDYTLYWGGMATSDERFRLSIKPAVGLRYLLSKEGHLGLDARIHYTHTPYAFDYIQDSINTLQFSLGLVYRWW